MAEKENIAIVQSVYNEVFNQRNFELADAIFAPTFRNHTGPPGMQDGPEGIKALVTWLFSAFPDDRHDIEDMLASGDRVAGRVLHHGTHQGQFMDLPPTGKHVSQEEMHIFRLEDGQLVEHWGVRDDLGFRQQMTSPAGDDAHA